MNKPTPATVRRELLLEPPEPLRVEMGDAAMAELVDSIKVLGVLHPLLVVPMLLDGDGTAVPPPPEWKGPYTATKVRFEIVDGHRRYTAATIAGLEELPVMIFPDAQQAKYAIMLHSNVCREDVTPYEEGVQFVELATKYQWSMDQLCRFFHKSEEYINDRAYVVQKDTAVAEALRDRRINLGQSKEILKSKDATCRGMLLEQAAVHGATINSLRVMRHNYDSEQAAAQGGLKINEGEQFVPGAVLPPEECVWCGNGDDGFNLVTIKVHNYHQKDLLAVLEQVGLRKLLKVTEVSS